MSKCHYDVIVCRFPITPGVKWFQTALLSILTVSFLFKPSNIKKFIAKFDNDLKKKGSHRCFKVLCIITAEIKAVYRHRKKKISKSNSLLGKSGQSLCSSWWMEEVLSVYRLQALLRWILIYKFSFYEILSTVLDTSSVIFSL